MRGHVFQVTRLGRRAPAHLAAARLHRQGVVARGGQGGVAAEHELHRFGRNRLLRHFVQRLQRFHRLGGFGLGAFDPELLETVCHLDLQRRLDAADVAVHRSAQMAHAQVVGRREGVSENQTDNPVKLMAPEPGRARPPEGVQSFPGRPGERLTKESSQ